MPVRYLNLFGERVPAQVEVFCNRGTAGIDGSISTAIGNAVGSGKPAWGITGDLSFQYDGNALWNGLVPTDLHIVIVNNSGGGIFRLIDGPSSVPELTERFETRTQTSACFKAEQFRLDYFTCDSEASVRRGMARIFANGWPRQNPGNLYRSFGERNCFYVLSTTIKQNDMSTAREWEKR